MCLVTPRGAGTSVVLGRVRVNRLSTVSTLWVLAALACNSDEGPCLTANAVRVDGVCECLPGKRTVGSTCISDPATDLDGSISGATVTDAETSVLTRDTGASRVDPEGFATAASDAAGGSPATARGGDAGLSTTPNGTAPNIESGKEPTPIKPTTCLATAETCDGTDNDCDGQIDEDVQNACGGCAVLQNPPGAKCSAGMGSCAATGTYSCSGSSTTICTAVGSTPTHWYRDCDGDGFASDASGSVSNCGVPPLAEPCKSWTDRMPVAADQDCDDSTPLRYPGAGFGLSTTSSSDRNCDGKVEAQYEFVDANNVYFTATSLPPVCTTNTECGCLAPFAFFNGYRSLDHATGNVDATYSATVYDYVAVPPPCAALTSDVVGTAPLPAGPDCRSGFAGTNVVLRKLCR
jgi:hypothetical protein